MTPLHHAALNGRTALIEILLAALPDDTARARALAARLPSSGATPMHPQPARTNSRSCSAPRRCGRGP